MQGSAASYDVFLSCSRADSDAAETLRARLREAGLSAFLDRYALPAGQPWRPWLEQHLALNASIEVTMQTQDDFI